MNSAAETGTLSVENYLTRIGCSSVPEPTVENLNLLQRSHLFHVPYENLDILTGVESSLEIPALYDKIVTRNRGGYCFELNGLFGWLLRKLGYEVTEFFARWHFGESAPIPFRRHRILKVCAEGRFFLADAGVGCPCPQKPLLFQESLIQERNGDLYRLIRDNRFCWMVQKKTEDGFRPFFSFDESVNYANDFDYAHFYCSHHPDSVFRKRLFVHLPTPSGRRSVSDVLNENRGIGLYQFRLPLPDGSMREFSLPDGAEFRHTLAEWFGIRLPETRVLNGNSRKS